MEFCEIITGRRCDRSTDKRCGFCNLRICFEHGVNLELRFLASPKHPRSDLNIYRSIVVLRGGRSPLGLGGGNATLRSFYEKVFSKISLPGYLIGYFCKGCAKRQTAFFLQILDAGFFPILRQVKADGFICEVEELCFLDVYRQACCYLCGKRSCYLHAEYCKFCKVAVCKSVPCRQKHACRHPQKGNLVLGSLDTMTEI